MIIITDQEIMVNPATPNITSTKSPHSYPSMGLLKYLGRFKGIQYSKREYMPPNLSAELNGTG